MSTELEALLPCEAHPAGGRKSFSQSTKTRTRSAGRLVIVMLEKKSLDGRRAGKGAGTPWAKRTVCTRM